MKRVICKLIGTGTNADPYRVNFPTYKLIEADYTSKIAVVDVLDEDIPEGMPTKTLKVPAITGENYTGIKYEAGKKDECEQCIRERYPEGFKQWNSSDAIST